MTDERVQRILAVMLLRGKLNKDGLGWLVAKGDWIDFVGELPLGVTENGEEVSGAVSSTHPRFMPFSIEMHTIPGVGSLLVRHDRGDENVQANLSDHDERPRTGGAA
jgi:hypothetical protein